MFYEGVLQNNTSQLFMEIMTHILYLKKNK
jgi:hypothetical protein